MNFMSQRPILFFVIMLLVNLNWSAVYAAPKNTEAEALAQARVQLQSKLKRIRDFHQAARQSMIDSIDLPLFKSYFSLPESRHVHYDNMGVIKLSDRQNRIRKQMEQWALTLHSRFPIGETCLIDKQGQEHMRVVGGVLNPPHLFSSEEHGSPFFNPTFELKTGEVHLSEPYMSEDSLYWVTSFTSPIILEDGSIPGFYHFEVPLEAYSDLIRFKGYSFQHFVDRELDTDEEGRYFIIDEHNQVIADSESNIDFNLPKSRNPMENPELPDYMPPEKLINYVTTLEPYLPGHDSRALAQQMHNEKRGVIRLHLKGNPYLLVFEQVPDRPNWILGHLDPIGNVAYWD